jgi:hypothetical protein
VNRAKLVGLALLCSAFTLAPLAPLAALDIAKDELSSVKDTKVVFVNYEGPEAVIESAAAIKGIGASLALAIGQPGKGPARAGDAARYSVIRAVDPNQPAGLDADLIVIGADAVVDHIANIRRIVAGYLEGAWGYSGADASTLAIFITVYNAVHRGDLAYIGSKYKTVVTKELTPANAGLSTRWDEWPGKTRIIIPLSSGAKVGAAGAVSTATISEKAVTETLKAAPNAGVPERQALVDIKEKEVAQGQAAAAAAKEEAKAADAALAAAKEQLAAAGAQLEAAKAAQPGPAAATAAGTGSPTDKGGAQAATTTTPAVAAAETAVAAAEAKVAAATTTAAEKSQAAAQADTAVAAKQAEVAQDRAAISQDQKTVIAAEVAAGGAAEAAGIWLFEVVDTAYPFARVVFVDAKTGKTIRASTLNTIRGRSVVDAGSNFVAVAGKEGGTGAIRLVAIDKKSLLQSAVGSTDIYAESALARIGTSYYATIKAADGKYYLGRFDDKLAEAARSTEAVNPLGFVTQGADGVVAQAAGGGFLSLDANSLALVKKLGSN